MINDFGNIMINKLHNFIFFYYKITIFSHFSIINSIIDGIYSRFIGQIHYSFHINGIESIQLSTLSGKILFDKKINKNEFENDLSKFAKGIYIIKIFTKNEVFADKIIKH
jgi:hypothetical protein